jgi:hypothetical protein
MKFRKVTIILLAILISIAALYVAIGWYENHEARQELFANMKDSDELKTFGIKAFSQNDNKTIILSGPIVTEDFIGPFLRTCGTDKMKSIGIEKIVFDNSPLGGAWEADLNTQQINKVGWTKSN